MLDSGPIIPLKLYNNSRGNMYIHKSGELIVFRLFKNLTGPPCHFQKTVNMASKFQLFTVLVTNFF